MQNGNVMLMARSPLATREGCAKAWEQVVKRQDENSGSNKYHIYFNLEASQGLLLADYIVIKATLMKLSLTDENIEEDIAYLRSKGYFINQKKKTQSINAAIKRSDNLITRMQMKENEIKKLQQDGAEKIQISFQDVITDLNFAIGWRAADENITLAAYNRYRTLLKQKDGRNNNTRRTKVNQ